MRRPLRSSSPTMNLTLPSSSLTHVPKCQYDVCTPYTYTHTYVYTLYSHMHTHTHTHLHPLTNTNSLFTHKISTLFACIYLHAHIHGGNIHHTATHTSPCYTHSDTWTYICPYMTYSGITLQCTLPVSLCLQPLVWDPGI